jgi:hypothetical protein
MWTCENRPKYNRDKLRYPSDWNGKCRSSPRLLKSMQQNLFCLRKWFCSRAKRFREEKMRRRAAAMVAARIKRRGLCR